MPKKLVFLCISILMLACKSDDNSIDLDCSTVLCAAVDDTIYLQFIDSETDDDLLGNDSIDANFIEVFNENNQEVTFTIEEYPDMGTYLAIPVSRSPVRQQSFTVAIEEGDSFTIAIETSSSPSGGCCGPYTTLESFSMDKYAFEPLKPSPLPVFTTVYIPNLN